MRTKSMHVSDDVERLVIVSDLHGFVEPLKVLDGLIASYQEKLQVVAAGDYVVTGARPVEAIEWVRANAGSFAVRGNHDENSVARVEGAHPPWTEAGASERLNPDQREYLARLPDVLELSWRGRCIRITHHRRPSGQVVSWMGKVTEVFDFFADPGVALVVAAHTHYPFVRKTATCCVANTGSISVPILGFRQDDGTVESRTEDSFEPDTKIFSTYLSVSCNGTGLEVVIERFDYDRAPGIERLRDAAHPDVERLRALLETGIC